MGKTLYLECYSGISGDMTVAALLDLGADESVLRKGLSSLPVSGFQIKISRVKKSGIDACDFSVILDKEHENHDHNMEYLHGMQHLHVHPDTSYPLENAKDITDEHAHEHNHEHTHRHEMDEHTHMHEYEHEHTHKHTHEHTHEHVHEHVHEHRGLFEINTLIDHADITENAKELAKKIFEILGKAEAKAHGVPIEEVHFHEVGAIDSIVDIISVAVCMDNLEISNVVVPILYEGKGFVRCQHGMIPIPVPAVLNIVKDNNLMLHITEDMGEFVTPTGAAIVAATRTSDSLPEKFKILKVGIGAGKRTYEKPSILRAMFLDI